MKLGFEYPNFGEKLAALYAAKGVDIAERGALLTVAQDMYKRGLIDFGDDEDEYDKLLALKRTLQRHLTEKSIDKISGLYIALYCRYFDCSADYFLGAIDAPTHEQQDVGAVTGLSGAAVTTLQVYHKKARTMHTAAIASYSLGQTGEVYNFASYDRLAAITSFLLRPNHCPPNGGGLLHLIGAYLTPGDGFSSGDLPDIVHYNGLNGNGFDMPARDFYRHILPNMIMAKLEEYRAEIEQKRKGGK